MESTEKAQHGGLSGLRSGRGLLVWMGAALTGLTLTASVAHAEGIPRDQGFMKEPKVVDYRMYLLAHKFDISAYYAMSVKNQLTQYYGAGADVAYNFNEFWALDLLLTGGPGGITDLTTQLRQKSEPFSGCTGGNCPNDVGGGGALLAAGQLGVRLTPIYGKFNVTAEVPIHFNFYFNAGVGVALVQYNQILGCETDPDPTTGVCPGGGVVGQFHAETKPAFAFNVGGGMRFYINQLLSVRLELRDIVFPDQEYKNVDPLHPQESRASNGYVSGVGLTQTPVLFMGVGFLL